MTDEPGFGKEEEIEGGVKEFEAARPLELVQAVDVDVADPRQAL